MNVRATHEFWPASGRSAGRVVEVGMILPADDHLARSFPQFFEPVDVAVIEGHAEPVGEVRCPGCSKLLAEMASAPYRLRCPRCKSVAVA